MKIIILIILSLPQLLLAKTIFEPNISLNAGSFKGSIPSAANSIEANYTTLAGGLRYGITRDYIHVTAVAEAIYLNMSSSDIETESKLKTNFGIGIGYEWNIPIRTYVTIGFPFSSVDVAYYYSEKMIIGLRYTQLKVEVNTSNLSVDTYGVAVSFPFEFDYPNYWWRKKDWQ